MRMFRLEALRASVPSGAGPGRPVHVPHEQRRRSRRRPTRGAPGRLVHVPHEQHDPASPSAPGGSTYLSCNAVPRPGCVPDRRSFAGARAPARRSRRAHASVTDQRLRRAHPSQLHDAHAPVTALAVPPVDPSRPQHRGPRDGPPPASKSSQPSLPPFAGAGTQPHRPGQRATSSRRSTRRPPGRGTPPGVPSQRPTTTTRHGERRLRWTVTSANPASCIQARISDGLKLRLWLQV
jgi:hypothetical protein